MIDSNFVKNLVDSFDLSSTSRFNQDQLNYLYNIGAKKFKAKDYVKAADIFQFLYICDGNNPLYPKSMAGCFHALGNYDIALIWYKYCYRLDSDNNEDCLFYCGIASFEAGNNENAKQYFLDFLSKSNDESLIKQSNVYLKIINKLIEGK